MRLASLLRRAVLATVVSTAVSAPPAAASSIVYIGSDGNVWLTSPDGISRYQVTNGGGWRSPSQADNGMIVAKRGGSFYRLTRSGQQIGQPVGGIGGDVPLLPGTTDRTTKFYGPYDPKVSPDGSQIAYWFVMDSPANPDGQLEDYVTTTPSDHFEGGPGMSLRTGRSPSWINDGRVLTYHPWAFGGANTSTWVPGGDSNNEQWWFSSPNGIMDDGELSPDGTKLVNTTATNGAASPFNTLWFWSLSGPAYTGQPPYSNPDPNAPPLPSLQCQNVRDSTVSSPTWSPDSRAIAYADQAGVWVENVPAAFDDQCSGMDEHLLVPGAIEPDWGPANVDMGDAPAFSQGGGTTGTGGTPPAAGGPAGGTSSKPATKPSAPKRRVTRCRSRRGHKRVRRCVKQHKKPAHSQHVHRKGHR
jgi:hypothetical protein